MHFNFIFVIYLFQVLIGFKGFMVDFELMFFSVLLAKLNVQTFVYDFELRLVFLLLDFIFHRKLALLLHTQ